MESLWDHFVLLGPNCPSFLLPYTLSTTRSSNLSSLSPNAQWHVNMVKQLLIWGASSEPNGIDVHFFYTKCVSSLNHSHSPLKKLGALDHILTTNAQTLWKPWPFVFLLILQRSQLLKLPFEGCYNSKYKLKKFPFSASTEPMDVSRRHAIVWATHRM